MGSGREGGSPSTAMASATTAKQIAVSSSVLTHKLQREELFEGGSNSAANPIPNARSRTPRAGNTPLHSPRSMSPLRGLSSTEMVSSEIASATLVDFQEAILRASNAQKAIVVPGHYNFQEEAMDVQTQETTLARAEDLSKQVLPLAITRSKSEVVHSQAGGGQQLRSKSPFPPSRTRSSVEDMDREASHPIRSSKRTDAANAEWVLLDRGKSPRRSKVSSSSTSLEAPEPSIERKSTRSSSRRSKVESVEDFPDADLGMGDANRATRRSHARPHTRQHKRKASESVTVVAAGASSPPEQCIAQQSPSLHHRQQQVAAYPAPPYRVERHSTAASSPTASSRRASREVRMVESSDWIQFVGDIIMWRHIPRSALLFGAGCFCIMSASLIQDMQCSMLSILAYTALFYLATRFIQCNFMRGSTSRLSFGQLTEADALRFIQVMLPPMNLMLEKLGDLFSGDPVVTLKVAGALWFLARVGSMMNVWTLVRVAYFALFTIPKCYSSYHEQIEVQVRNATHWICSAWSACGHKKAVLFGGFVVAWNFSSVSTRVCGVFLALVGVRAYRHAIQSQLDVGSSFFNQERFARMSSGDLWQ